MEHDMRIRGVLRQSQVGGTHEAHMILSYDGILSSVGHGTDSTKMYMHIWIYITENTKEVLPQ